MSEFSGFPKELLTFFKNLEKNNTQAWFNDHKKDYETFVKKPSSDFVIAMGEKLESIAPGIKAIPKVNQSLFRLNRDTRFSKDKTPYKTNMGIWFWEGDGKRMECSGFYFHLENSKLMLGAGIYMFPKHLIEAYRDAVVDPIRGGLLKKTLKNLEKNGYSPGGKHYKRIPRGYDADHENADYLLFNGFHCGNETSIPKEFHTKELISYAFKEYKKMLPLHEWLRDSVVG
ncbi:MAG: DUF2461 domain-containing protein [Proteobacteria bacterium]|nr:DUF2461 domain-containing protein [Pseudomonadota bacterium]